MPNETPRLPAARSACPIAASLDLFGDRWTLLILRDLLLDGRSQFSELASNEGIATNILSDRLQRLQKSGLVARTRHPDDGRRWLYSPTQTALTLIPALVELLLWGTQHTEGSAPDWLLQAARDDRSALLEQLTSMAGARVIPAV